MTTLSVGAAPFDLARAAAAARAVGRAIAAPPAPLLALHCLLLGALSRIVCIVVGVETLPLIDGEAWSRSGGDDSGSDDAAPPPPPVADAALAAAAAVARAAASAESARTARPALATLQRAAQLLRLIVALAPVVAPLLPTVSSFRALTAALAAFLALHVGPVAEASLSSGGGGGGAVAAAAGSSAASAGGGAGSGVSAVVGLLTSVARALAVALHSEHGASPDEGGSARGFGPRVGSAAVAARAALYGGAAAPLPLLSPTALLALGALQASVARLFEGPLMAFLEGASSDAATARGLLLPLAGASPLGIAEAFHAALAAADGAAAEARGAGSKRARPSDDDDDDDDDDDGSEEDDGGRTAAKRSGAPLPRGFALPSSG
jgi:hypothetical protein